MKIAVLTTEKLESLRLAKRVFPDARLIPVEPQSHDREVALVLSLTHLVGMAYGAVVGKSEGIGRFKELASPSSLLQLTVAESILAQDPSLCSYMDVENPSSLDFLHAFQKELGTLEELLSHHDRGGFEEKFTAIPYLGEAKLKRVLSSLRLLSTPASRRDMKTSRLDLWNAGKPIAKNKLANCDTFT